MTPQDAIEVLKLEGVPDEFITLLELWWCERLLDAPTRMHIVEEAATRTRIFLAQHGIV